jgi:hypothetical protein
VGQRLTHRRYSPAVIAAAVTAAAAAPSFEAAARLLEKIGDLTISPRHLQSLTHEVGGELVAERERRTAEHRERPLMASPRRAEPPLELAAVMVDGGRMQTRAAGSGPGARGPHWRETKAAVLLRMAGEAPGEDPHPDLPACFAVAPLSGRPAAGDPAPAGAAPSSSPPWGPRPLVRTGLATLRDSDAFGPMLAAAAESRGFFSAARGAFLGDGQAYNWTIHHRYFADFTAIVDFVHVAEHLHEAARAAGEAARGREWAEACWRGRAGEVIAELGRLRAGLPVADPEAEPEAAWSVLGRVCGYLENNAGRMDYPAYRRQGLPITSSPVESWIKQINQRVKGSEKFWEDGPRGEAILQVRAAWLGEDEALDRHLRERPGSARGRPGRDRAA